MTPADFRAARLRLGLTQAGIGAQLGVTGKSVRQWEAGARSISAPVALLLARLLENPPVVVKKKRGRPKKPVDLPPQ